MTDTAVSIATLAAPLPAPPAPAPPALPPAPPQLRGGGPGVGPLPDATGKVARLPVRYMAGPVMLAGITLLLTLVSLVAGSPGSVEQAVRQRFAASRTPTQPQPQTPPQTQPRPVPPRPTSPVPTRPTVNTIPQATLDAASSGRPVPVELTGVTPPEPRGGWPRVDPGPRYADHVADVTVRFVVQADGSVDPASIELSGPGAAPLRDATVGAYTALRFQPGRVGTRAVPVLMSHRFRFPT
jgi:hypothetical protein